MSKKTAQDIPFTQMIDHPIPESELVALAVDGDVQAFEQLFRRWEQPIYSLCCRYCNNRFLAEELTQEIFLLVWRKLYTFKGKSAFGTWLYRIAVNLISRKIKRYNHESDTTALQEEFAADSTCQRESLLDLEAAIATLPPKAKSVLILYELENLGHRQISEILKISEGTCKAHLHRAKKLLKKELS